MRTTYQLNAVGLDPSGALLRSGQRRDPSLRLIQSSGEYLPLATDQFAAALTECSLSVMRDSDRALAELGRALHSGGYLILSDIYARIQRALLPWWACRLIRVCAVRDHQTRL